jgi:hypothetical protein
MAVGGDTVSMVCPGVYKEMSGGSAEEEFIREWVIIGRPTASLIMDVNSPSAQWLSK